MGVLCLRERCVWGRYTKAEFNPLQVYNWFEFRVFIQDQLPYQGLSCYLPIAGGRIVFPRVLLIFRSDWETLYLFLLFQSPVGSFIFACEAFDKPPIGVQVTKLFMLWKSDLRSDSAIRFINLSFRKSSNETRCTNHFTFNWKLFFHVTFDLLVLVKIYV